MGVLFSCYFDCLILNRLIQGVDGAVEVFEREHGQIAGVESRGIGGDDLGRTPAEKPPEMLGGFQTDIAILVNIRTQNREGSIVKGLIAHRADDDIHISCLYPEGFA